MSSGISILFMLGIAFYAIWSLYLMIEHQDVNNINSYQTIISSNNTYSFYQNYLAFQLISYIAIELSSSKNNYSTYFKLIPLFIVEIITEI